MPRKTPTISFVSLGCSKNLVDSERMLGLLAQDGFAIVPDSEAADLVVVNTCGFIDAARRESVGVIEEMLKRKRSGEVKGVIVAGCLAERQKDCLFEQFPEVDEVVGVFGREEIARIAGRLLGGLHEQRGLFRPAPIQAQDDRARLRITPRHLAYLKVSEGCDRFCTFCAIPFMRGKHVTKPIEMVVAEAKELAGDGVRELVLVAQDMTYYGVDLYGRPRLAELLRELERVESIDWIRVLYCYPQFFTDELYETLAQSPKIIPYLDMPLQHINDRLLKLMNRRHTRRETESIIARLRASIPGLVLRTTFIVGFPGETEAEFAELLDFVTATRFERLGVFTYSLEPDTPAAKLPEHIPGDVAEERRDRLMAAQQPLALAFNKSLVGTTLDVLIDAPAPEGRNLWQGRTYADAPDVDGVTWVRGSRFRPGDLVSCEITGAREYDLIARALAAPAPRGHRAGRAVTRRVTTTVESPPSRRRRARPGPRPLPGDSSLVILDDV
jgi:ribosomal protein S12 methylthiotransferase